MLQPSVFRGLIRLIAVYRLVSLPGDRWKHAIETSELDRLWRPQAWANSSILQFGMLYVRVKLLLTLLSHSLQPMLERLHQGSSGVGGRNPSRKCLQVH